jgi:hypothetical protein
MSLFKEDRDYFWRSTDQQVCRGVPSLSKLLKEMQEGVSAQYGMTTMGGFSTQLEPCKRFARPHDTRYKPFDPPAVYTTSKYRLQEEYPNAMEVCYTEDWLKEHPEAVDVMQTFECAIDRPLERKISSCMCYKDECEIIFPETTHLRYPGYTTYEGQKKEWGGGDINVFISDVELTDLANSGDIERNRTYALPLRELKEAMDVARMKVEEKIPKDLEIDNINIFLCDSTMSMNQEKCLLYDTVYQQYRK